MKKLFCIFFLFLCLFSSCIEETITSGGPNIETKIEETTGEFMENEINALTYNQKLSAFIEEDYVTNESFYNYIINDKEYVDDSKLVDNAIFVSIDGSGTGSISDPCSIYTAVEKVEAGQTIYLRGGNYKLDRTINITKSGKDNNYITIRNYPNEHVYISSSFTENTKWNEFVVFALKENVSYVKIEGLEIADISAQNVLGIVAWGGGQNNIIIRNNSIHDLKTSSTDINDSDSGANAILLLGENYEPINNVLIYGNECYNNATGWCETISVSSNCESVYVIENYVHDNTNIGIDFYGNAGYCDDKALDQPRYCVAALNKIEASVCEYADAAGLYVDGARDILLTNNYIKSSQYGIEVGAEELSEGYPVKNIIIRNNIMYKNFTCGLRVGGYNAKECGYVTSTKIYNNTIINSSNSGSGVITISKVDGIEFVNNLIYSEINATLVLGDMPQTYSKNITFNNNYFNVNSKSELSFKLYRQKQTGLDEFNAVANGINITGSVTFDRQYRVTEGVTINAGVNNVNYGIYDYEMKNRINGKKIDIGAYEY